MLKQLTSSVIHSQKFAPTSYFLTNTNKICNSNILHFSPNFFLQKKYFCSENSNELVLELKDTSHFEQLQENSKEYLLVDFYGTWCKPCIMLKPKLEERTKKLNGKVKMQMVDIDKHRDLASAANITGVPAVFMIKDKDTVDSFMGFVDDKRLDSFFANVK